MPQGYVSAASLVVVALISDFLNGFHDSANIVATMIAFRAMAPGRALLLSRVAHFVAPFLFGVAVATTIGKDAVSPETITVSVFWLRSSALSSGIS